MCNEILWNRGDRVKCLNKKTAIVIAIGFVLLICSMIFGFNVAIDELNQPSPIKPKQYIHIGGATPDTPLKTQVTEVPTNSTEVTAEKSTEAVTEASTEKNTEIETETPTETIDTSKVEVNDTNNLYQYTDTELLAKLIYTEAGSCGEYCQWLVGSTIMNLADLYDGLQNIAYDSTKFDSYTINKLNSCVPSDLSIKVANRILSGDRDTIPMAFRMGYYHNFGMPYTNVDNVYFSTF